MSNYTFPFEKLDVWQDALDLAYKALTDLEKIPITKHHRLVAQMEGAVAPVSQNIAEGKGRQHKKKFLQFLSFAQGSLYETVTLCGIFEKLRLFTEDECQQIRMKAERLDRKLHGLMNALRGKKRTASNLLPPP